MRKWPTEKAELVEYKKQVRWSVQILQQPRPAAVLGEPEVFFTCEECETVITPTLKRDDRSGVDPRGVIMNVLSLYCFKCHNQGVLRTAILTETRLATRIKSSEQKCSRC